MSLLLDTIKRIRNGDGNIEDNIQVLETESVNSESSKRLAKTIPYFEESDVMIQLAIIKIGLVLDEMRKTEVIEGFKEKNDNLEADLTTVSKMTRESIRVIAHSFAMALGALGEELSRQT